jgi:hypothetical protein
MFSSGNKKCTALYAKSFESLNTLTLILILCFIYSVIQWIVDFDASDFLNLGETPLIKLDTNKDK